MKKILWVILWFCFNIYFSLNASPATEASSALKGFFGESLVDDIYQAAGRQIVPYKMDPNLHGPDRIYRLANGFYEIHEVKAYTSWAGKTAMRTTSGGVQTYELSRRWCEDWISKTLNSTTTTAAEKSAARTLADALKHNRVKFIFDEFNLTTQQFRVSEVIQVGKDEVVLTEKMGPVNLKRFNQFFSRKSKDFLKMKIGNFDNTFSVPSVHQSWQPLSRKDQLKLLPEKAYKEADVKRIEVHNALLTQDGRLLVAVKSGVKTGVMVFAADSGHAVYEYANGDILKPELQRKIADAAVKGTFVGTCVGVTVFLGATPTGWCVLAVSVGSYFIVDQSLKVWHRYQDSKCLTIDDLRSWGIISGTVLELEKDTIFKPPENTVLKPELDTILDLN